MISINKGFRDVEIDSSEPNFVPGDLVEHVRYGYRGVVVASDGYCKADPQWYMANKTQPTREQPWYHVLVHGTAASTYAAQTSLRAGTILRPVEHPWIELFFTGFADGRHIRNEKPFA